MSVKRHTAFNVAGTVIPLVGLIVTLPIYLRTIGEDRYGVLVILWTVLGYFGLFDLGLGRAVANRIAAFKDRTPADREEVFWTALLLSFALGCAAALLIGGAGALLFERFIDAPGSLVQEAYAALPWMAMALPLLLVSSVMSGALIGREEFLAENAVKTGMGLLTQAVPLVVALKISPELPALVMSVLVVRLVSALAAFGLCVRQLPIGLKPRATRSHVRPLFAFGGWIAVTSIIGPLLTALDRVIIAAVAGAKAVTYYAVPFSLGTSITIIPASLSSALFPRFSSLKDYERDALLNVAVRSLVVFVTPLVVAAMLIMEPFLIVWVSAEFAEKAAPAGEILVIGFWANCLAYLPFTHIQASGRPDIAAKFHLAELLPYLAVLWMALQWRGPVGAALAWSLRVWVDAALMFWASGFRGFRILATAGGVIAISLLGLIFTSGTEWQGLVIRSALVFAAIIWGWVSAPTDLKATIHRLFRFSRVEVTSG